MSEDTNDLPLVGAFKADGSAEKREVRYSLKEMMGEVKVERRDFVFGRELVDSTEIDKMFSKQIRKKKRG